jgi:DNA-binding CsgD family transcriptional regulator
MHGADKKSPGEGPMGIGAAVLVLDDAGRIVFANQAAAKLLAEGALRIDAGRLRVNGGLAGSALQALLAEQLQTLKPEEGQKGNVLLEQSSEQPLAILVSPMWCFGDQLARKPATLLIATRLDRHIELSAEDVAGAYGLTRAESELLSALISGESLSEYCARAGITVNTGKTHLRQVFGKTHTNRQSELVREVLMNPLIHLEYVFR